MSELPSEQPRRRGRPPSSERIEDLRTAAIETAGTLLITNGAGLSMESLARQLGVRAPSLYHHFPGGRDEMVLAVAAHHCNQFGIALRDIVATPGPARLKLRAVASYLAGSGAVHPYNVLAEERSLISPASRDSLQALFTRTVESPMLELLHQGIADGEFHTTDPELAMRSLLALFLRLPQMIGTPQQKAVLPAFVADLVLDGIAARPDHPPAQG